MNNASSTASVSSYSLRTVLPSDFFTISLLQAALSVQSFLAGLLSPSKSNLGLSTPITTSLYLRPLRTAISFQTSCAPIRPLDDVVSFSIALKRSRAAFGLITRIRSLWDKSFLYVALTYEGDATVRQFQNQRSKRKFFFRHFAPGFGAVTAETLTLASDALDSLERDFRTPELHGFGKIRKWVFNTPADWDTQHLSAILEHWSVLNRFLFEGFADSSTSRSSIEDKVFTESAKTTSTHLSNFW
jgi:hypothetical protein